MYTKCPECDAIFRVTDEQLSVAEGLVRCGICDAVFNGRERIEEDHNPDIESGTQIQDEEPLETETEAEETYREEEWDDLDEDKHEDEGELIDIDVIPTVIRDDFGGNPLTKSNSPMHITVFTIGAIALAIFFLGQISYWQEIDILPRSWVNSFCKPLGCDEQSKRNVEAIKILNRNIYTHPNVKKALMITTSFVNQAQTAQPYPILQISLLDTQGKIVAARQFSPKDYLVNKSLVDTLMSPNQPVGARLEVLDPGSKVIAYEFEFL